MGPLGGNSYGDIFASDYDATWGDHDDLELVSDVLNALAKGGSALEFGVGTGRVALPLAQRGVRVVGVDNSQEMLRMLRAKPGGENVTALLDDCVALRLEERFNLVYFIISSIYLLGSQEQQVECFRNAARHLVEGGVFLVEGFVHDRTRWVRGQEYTITKLTENSATLRLGMLDPLAQVIHMNVMELSSTGVKTRPDRLRFIYPSEMDLMARLAGMRLIERWSGWDRTPATANSGMLISVYEKVAAHPL